MCALTIHDAVRYPRRVVTIQPRASLMEAIGLMRRNDIHHLVVMSEQTPVGVLSDRNIIQKGLASHSVVLNPIMSVGEVMLPLTKYLTDRSDLSEAIALMRQEGTSALPLVAQGELTGIVTESDLLNILCNLLVDAPSHPGVKDLDATEKGRLLLGNPLVQNVMKLLSEMGI